MVRWTKVVNLLMFLKLPFVPQGKVASIGNLTASMSQLPETVLQFGTGKFLRSFADLFIHQANKENQMVGHVVAVQSTGDQRANLINSQAGRYHVLVRGQAEGDVIDRV